MSPPASASGPIVADAKIRVTLDELQRGLPYRRRRKSCRDQSSGFQSDDRRRRRQRGHRHPRVFSADGALGLLKLRLLPAKLSDIVDRGPIHAVGQRRDCSRRRRRRSSRTLSLRQRRLLARVVGALLRFHLRKWTGERVGHAPRLIATRIRTCSRQSISPCCRLGGARNCASIVDAHAVPAALRSHDRASMLRTKEEHIHSQHEPRGKQPYVDPALRKSELEPLSSRRS